MARSKTEGWSAAVLFRKQQSTCATELHFPSLEAASDSGSAFAIFRNGWSEPNANKAGHGTGFYRSSQLSAQRCHHWRLASVIWNIIKYHWIKPWNPFFERTCASNQVIHNPRLFLLCANLDILNVHIYTATCHLDRHVFDSKTCMDDHRSRYWLLVLFLWIAAIWRFVELEQYAIQSPVGCPRYLKPVAFGWF